tara:strand:- start:15167 stop:15904 length:738 start_codon:yes stop_codon:yes gene_type:complete
MCTVTAVVIGVISGGLQIAQQYQQVAAQNRQIEHANAQADQNYAFQQLQATSNRTHENQRKMLQDDMMAQTRYFANAAHGNDIAQLNTQLLQEQAATAAKKRKANRRALELMGEVTAAGRVGNTVGTLLADYRRQKEFFDYNSSKNLAFTGAQNMRRREASQIERGSRIASQQPYLKRTILDPVKPLQAPKMKGPGVIGWLSAAASGAQMGYGVHTTALQSGFTANADLAAKGANKNFWGYYRKA